MENCQIYTEDSYPGDILNSLAKPRLVLSLIGDSKGFIPKVWCRPVFKTGIVDTAKRAGGCWITYSGLAFGLGGLVGEIIRDYDMQMSKIHKSDCQKGSKDDGIHLVAITSYNVLYKPDEIIEPAQQLALDKNAHHYIFIKHNTKDKKKITCRYRQTLVEIEKYISSQSVPFFRTEEGKFFEMRIPVVIVVLEGDINTVEHVALAVEQDIPILLIEGTGKAADLLSECIIKGESLRMKGPTLFGIYLDKEEFERLDSLIERIRQKKWLINVFILQSDDPYKMSEIVADSVMRAWAMEYALGKTSPSEDDLDIPETKSNVFSCEQLKSQDSSLRISISSSPALTSPTKLQFAVSAFMYPSTSPSSSPITEGSPGSISESTCHPTSPLHFHLVYQLLQETGRLLSKNGEKLLFEAVKEDRGDFVQILLQQGVVFREDKFWDLYTQEIDSRATPRLFSEPVKKRKKRFNLTSIEAAKTMCQNLLRYSPAIRKKKSNSNQPGTTDKVFINDLLLWAVFSNNKEMAEIFWQTSSNPILAALISSVIADRLAKSAERVKQDILSEQFEEHSRLFEEKAMDLLDKLFEQDDETAMLILRQNVVVWDIETSPMAFAYQYNRMNFLAHRCCQITLDKKWYAGIASDFRSFFTVRFRVEEEGKSVSGFKKVQKFITAPLNNFFINYIIFFIFLVLFSLFLIKGVGSVSSESVVLEYLIGIWMVGDMFEEILCEVCREGSYGSASRHTFSFYFRRWIYDFWNCMDLASYLIFTAAFISKRLENTDTTGTYLITRRLYTSALFMVYMRFLYAFLMGKKVGPVIIMIKQMLGDLWRFMLILVVFIAAVGVAYHVNRFPNQKELFGDDMKQWTIWQVWSLPFWQLFGETFLEELEGDGTFDCVNETGLNTTSIYECPRYDWIVMLISALYMLFSNLLLVNVVIAMFSYRFGKVQVKSKTLWKYYRYSVVTEYETKIPSPLNILIRPMALVLKLIRKCRNCKQKEIEYQGVKEREESIKLWQNVNAPFCVRFSRQASGSSSTNSIYGGRY